MNKPRPTINGPTDEHAPPSISLIIPVYNEEQSIRAVLDEAVQVLDALHEPYEILLVNDGSTDGTASALKAACQQYPTVRVFTVVPNSGQSAAFGVGFRECRGQIAVLMDGDGQNDPQDIPPLIAALKDCDACCGYRASRQDSISKRLGSRIANRIRQLILHDGIRDTGCSLKAVKTEFLRNLPMEFRGMHRFLPAFWIMRGARIKQMPVRHRPRAGGHSKYTNLGRLKETIWDLWAVRWMQRRYRHFHIEKGENS